ncbi:MAG TPA: hypothetical protein VMJ10_28940 [Kofleriaceae bacterium]|nr:hypothetical protein [Kofleriaceae bacterium]
MAHALLVVTPAEAANSNEARPVVVLHPTGDGSILYRTLARVLVRQQIFANAIPENTDCEQTKAAG